MFMPKGRYCYAYTDWLGKRHYIYIFNHIIKKDFGKRKAVDVKYTDVLTYYYGLNTIFLPNVITYKSIEID